MRHLSHALFLVLIAGATSAFAQSPSAAAAQQELAAAEARYRSAIALAPNMGAYHFSLGLVLRRQGRNPEALKEFELAVSLDSMASRPRAGYGQALLDAGRAADAIPQLQAAARLDPTSVAYREMLGRAYGDIGRWREAASTLRDAAQISPGDTRLNAELGKAESKANAGGAATEYHDYSDFEDDVAAAHTPIIEIILGVIFSLAALVLLAPVAGMLFLLAGEAALIPFRRFRRA